MERLRHFIKIVLWYTRFLGTFKIQLAYTFQNTVKNIPFVFVMFV